MSDLPNVAAPKDFQVGETIAGRYRLDRILGVGGMGLVFAATHLELEQVVAVKFIRAGLASAEARSRFLREARAVVKLRSEHVARVLDAGTLDTGDSYMVMEYLDGTDLAVHLKARGTLPVEEASAYVLQAAEGLAEAHAMGIVHRDLKPANLFLARSPAGLPLVKVGGPVYNEPLGVAFDKSGPDPTGMVAKVNEILDAMRTDGTLKGFSQKWFKRDMTVAPGA